VLLGLAGEGGRRCDAARVLDVRRADERALYGSIPGARRSGCEVWGAAAPAGRARACTAGSAALRGALGGPLAAGAGPRPDAPMWV
jgi:hypothetical protein